MSRADAIEAGVQAILESRRKNNVSGQGAEDVESIRAGLLAGAQAPHAETALAGEQAG